MNQLDQIEGSFSPKKLSSKEVQVKELKTCERPRQMSSILTWNAHYHRFNGEHVRTNLWSFPELFTQVQATE